MTSLRPIIVDKITRLGYFKRGGLHTLTFWALSLARLLVCMTLGHNSVRQSPFDLV